MGIFFIFYLCNWQKVIYFATDFVLKYIYNI